MVFLLCRRIERLTDVISLQPSIFAHDDGCPHGALFLLPSQRSSCCQPFQQFIPLASTSIMSEDEERKEKKKRRKRSRKSQTKEETTATDKEQDDDAPKEDDSISETPSHVNDAVIREDDASKVDDDDENGEQKPKRKRKRKRKSKQAAASGDTPIGEKGEENINAKKLTSLDLTVYVEGIPFDCSEEDVKDFFVSNGCEDIIQLRLPR